MSQEDTDALKNASAIIERFGGIRPMAAKIGAPVTTVQGWKKRDVIPGARRGDVIKAANDNGIDIADLLVDGSVAAIGLPSAIPSNSDEPRITIEPIIKPQAKSLPPSFQTKIDTTHEELMSAIAMGQKKAVNASLWSTAIFVVLVGAGAAFVMWPSAQKIEKHEAQLATIEGKMSSIDTDVQTMNETAQFLKGMVPEDVQKGMNDLREQADQIQKKVTDVAVQAEDIRERVLATDAGSMGDRLSVLEAKFREIDGGQQLADLTARVRGLEGTFVGQEQLSASVDELRKIVDSLDGQVNTIDSKLAQTQKVEGSELGKTLEGVSGSDLKAAAMLIAFSQLRDSLNRSAPFKEDLVLLQKLAGDDKELQMALNNLAPQAEKGGVLTKEGLSEEFKTFGGDIVFSSLKGEDVSITEKAKVRLTEIVNVKKDGKVVGGNPTQQAVAAAQAQLDEGDVQGAIATLQSLDGDAKTAAQPFIDQANATLIAEQVQNLLRQTILAKVGADVTSATGAATTAITNTLAPVVAPAPAQAKPTAVKPAPSKPVVAAPASAPSLTPSDVQAKIEEALPGESVVQDEESGFEILPAPKGFKGFSTGNE